jgi:hypothetical protein
MSDTQRLESAALSVLRDVLTSDSPLALVEPTKKLARMLGGSGLASIETQPSSIGMPNGGLSSHCSREISGAQVYAQGDSQHATSPLPR